jgi:hypothetical protein
MIRSRPFSVAPPSDIFLFEPLMMGFLAVLDLLAIVSRKRPVDAILVRLTSVLHFTAHAHARKAHARKAHARKAHADNRATCRHTLVCACPYFVPPPLPAPPSRSQAAVRPIHDHLEKNLTVAVVRPMLKSPPPKVRSAYAPRGTRSMSPPRRDRTSTSGSQPAAPSPRTINLDF